MEWMTADEERELDRQGPGPRLWDADPDVCCAAFQLGACPHTEADYDYEDMATLGADEPEPTEPEPADVEADEPF